MIDYVDDDSQVLDDDTVPAKEEQPLISLNAITSIQMEDTILVRITMGPHEITTLLDSRLTHNFVSAATANKVSLHFNAGTVVVANDDRVVCSGLGRDVTIKIGDKNLSIDCYSIPLDCYDMVLRVTFLHTLEPILWDFDDFCMAF